MTMTINHVSRRRLVDRVINEKTLAKYYEHAMRFQQWMSDSSLMHALRLPSQITVVGDRLLSDPERLLKLISTVS